MKAFHITQVMAFTLSYTYFVALDALCMPVMQQKTLMWQCTEISIPKRDGHTDTKGDVMQDYSPHV